MDNMSINGKHFGVIKGERDLDIQFLERKVDTLGELVSYAVSTNHLEAEPCINKYIEVLRTELEELHINFEELYKITKEIEAMDGEYFRQSNEFKIKVQDKEVFYQVHNSDLKMMYSIGYDEYYKQFKYGYIEFGLFAKGKIRKTASRVLFNKGVSLQTLINTQNYFTSLIEGLNHAESLEQLETIYQDVKSKIALTYRVKDFADYFREKSNLENVEFGIPNYELVTDLDMQYEKKYIQLRLASINLPYDLDALSKLVKAQLRYNINLEKKAEIIDVYDEGYYNEKLNRSKSKIAGLMEKLSISEDELQTIIKEF